MEVDTKDLELLINESHNKHYIQDYELNLETKPISITMDSEEKKDLTVDEILIKVEAEGKVAKEKHDQELRERIDKINKEIEFKNNEETKRRDKITRIRIIALSNLNVHPMTHTMDLTEKMRKAMINECDKIMTEMNDEEITEKFNKIVCEEILNNKSDYTKYPVYHY